MSETLFDLPEPPLRVSREGIWYWITRPRPIFKGTLAWKEWHWARGLDPDRQRQRLPAKTRRAVIERDGLVCGLCGDGVELEDVHIDHVVPVAHGGGDALENLQVAHSFCNISKGARAWVNP